MDAIWRTTARNAVQHPHFTAYVIVGTAFLMTVGMLACAHFSAASVQRPSHMTLPFDEYARLSPVERHDALVAALNLITEVLFAPTMAVEAAAACFVIGTDFTVSGDLCNVIMANPRLPPTWTAACACRQHQMFRLRSEGD